MPGISNIFLIIPYENFATTYPRIILHFFAARTPSQVYFIILNESICY